MSPKPLVLLSILLMIGILPTTAYAQRVEEAPGAKTMRDQIAAVVNDNVITTADIQQRMSLALLSSGMPPSAETEQRLLPQVLRSLIDEQLQLQEAKRLDISASKDDLDHALDRIAHENNLPTDMRSFVAAHGVSPTALEQQVRASLLWSKVVQRELRPKVEVGDDEIDSMVERMKASMGKNEFLVSEIFLSVENPKDDDATRDAAQNLVNEIKGGASFPAVARQFSQSTGAASGGDIGWIQEGQLGPEMNKVLLALQPNEVSNPIRTSNGYHILALRDKRVVTLNGDGSASSTKLDLQQIFHPFDNTDDQQNLTKQAATIRNLVTDCNSIAKTLADGYPGWHEQSLGSIASDKVPGWMNDNIHNLQPGRGSDPIMTAKGALVVFVCGRHDSLSNVDRETLMNSIGTEKLELQARGLMRDLHRAATIDIRLGKAS